MLTSAAILKNGLALPLKAEHRTPIGPNNSTPRYVPERTENTGTRQHLYMNVHMSTLFIIAPKEK